MKKRKFTIEEYLKVSCLLHDLKFQNDGIPLLGDAKLLWIDRADTSKYVYLTDKVCITDAISLTDENICRYVVHELTHRNQAKKWKILYPVVRIIPFFYYNFFEKEALEMADAALKLLGCRKAK